MGIAHLLSCCSSSGFRLKAKTHPSSERVRVYVCGEWCGCVCVCIFCSETQFWLKAVARGAQVNSLCSVCFRVQKERECIFSVLSTVVRNRVRPEYC